MADYYTKPEADFLFAAHDHSHNLEDLGGNGLYANQVRVPDYLSSFYDNSYDLADGLDSIKKKFEAIPAAPDLSGFAPATHTHAQADIAGLESVLSSKAELNHVHSYNSITNKPVIPTVPASLPANGGNADTVGGKKPGDFAAATHNHDETYAKASHSHTGTYATASHNHNADYVSKGLQATDDVGGVEFSFAANSGKNVLTEIKGMGAGFHTIYAVHGTEGNPDTTESYRYFLHKTSSTIGWVMAFGSSGSVYTNYINGESGWRGWKAIFDATPKALWNGENNGTGGYIMNASHTVTPSKPLSQCRTGWMLIWADFDSETKKFNEYDFCSTVIPKIKPNNGKWAGQPHIFPVASYVKNASPHDGETIRVKTLQVYDDKLVGHAANSADNRSDIVLRAVYEI